MDPKTYHRLWFVCVIDHGLHFERTVYEWALKSSAVPTDCIVLPILYCAFRNGNANANDGSPVCS